MPMSINTNTFCEASKDNICELSIMNLRYVVLLIFVLLASTTVRNQATLGVWNPIKNINDPYVTEIANYAVDEHDKRTGLNLKLEKVISGETKIVDGIIYCLNITATDNSASSKYNIAVLDKLSQHFRNLTSFVPISD
ncbi:cysteine proteinase inhibitor 5-like [Trifolium pratense]|uniref:cysteine proteinase inhibitor 5-like n=1 Tax=Trifolium pratense TaxID=57577 RepID=UPI001E69453C|nr:cysteine proteinase inhibitor 5-like [Trifolium pratense]XP_045802316.1 cysteine proteinase inhibitor 5-like [Trifolium pratense]XP_045802317.1 cysteine proteinase inhibitor 5-like [Trifolium pratense]XP_045802318.1 cysteine proteinase inhibitor 5-like [Trifolium pratense]XP_045802319.1 cysteine proteinase inhibitor 5-like [Trifolium pratense]XP_045802321.1 cysteine proteinase inhibitor 5-like [Trifolium pratense]